MRVLAKGLMVAAGLFTGLLAVKGMQDLRRKNHQRKAFRRLDRKLDEALEASMDASDAVARY